MSQARILIIGAGAMGIVTGYILGSGGAAITYLVRPNRREALLRPQILYSYDENDLIEFGGYSVITDPSEIARDAYDFVIFTIDGMALRGDEGQALVRAVGAAARGTGTKVLIGTIGVNLRPGFLATSELAENQVFSGGLYIVAYQVDRVTLPLHPPTDPALLAQADLAYRQATPVGMFVDDSAPEAAARFAALFGASGRAQCVVLPEQAYATQVPAAFPVFAACDIVGWRGWQALTAEPGLLELTAAAVSEVQGLAINGEDGRAAQGQTTPDSIAGLMRQMEEETRPMDFLAFNRFHHGGKVFEQDVRLLEDCVALGAAEGRPMRALKDLIARTLANRGWTAGERPPADAPPS